MNRSAAVTRIQRRLGMRSDLTTEIIDALQDAQVELELAPSLPWFLKQESNTSLVTVANQQYVNAPIGFIRFADDGALWYYDSTADEDEQWVELERDNNLTLRLAYNAATGAPEAYHFLQQKFYLFPLPDDAYTLRLTNFYQAGVLLDTDVENEWLLNAPKLIIGRAGRHIAEIVRDAGALAAFEKMEMEGRKELDDFQTAREEEGQVRQMGGKD